MIVLKEKYVLEEKIVTQINGQRKERNKVTTLKKGKKETVLPTQIP